jgi:hypothetical protein
MDVPIAATWRERKVTPSAASWFTNCPTPSGIAASQRERSLMTLSVDAAVSSAFT